MKFRAGDFSRDDAPQLGRPVEIYSNHIEILIENNQYYTTRKTGSMLKIAKSSLDHHSYQLGSVHRFDVWVPHKWKKPS